MSDELNNESVTQAHLMNTDDPQTEEVVSIEERLDISRRENHALFMELAEERKRSADLQQKFQDLEDALDPANLPMAEKARRFREDPQSLGIPDKNPALQRDTSNDVVPTQKRRHVTEDDLRKMSTEEIANLDPRDITKPWRPF